MLNKKNDVNYKKKIFFLLKVFGLFVLFFCCGLMYKFWFSSSTQKTTLSNNANIKENYYKYNHYGNVVNLQLEHKIKLLEINIDKLTNTIDDLKQKISFLTNFDSKNLTRIQIAIKFQNNLYLDNDVDIDLSPLKFLEKEATINNDFFLLEQYKSKNVSYNTLKNDFYTELNSYLLQKNFKNKKNKFINLFSNLIKIQKIDNFKKDSDDFFVFQLEKYINAKNYALAFDLLKNNDKLQHFFSKTYANLEVKFVLEHSIEKVINYLLQND